MSEAIATDQKIDNKSREVIQRLARELTECNIMALVGAGVSARAGFPTWAGLLDLMDKEIEKTKPRPAHVRKFIKAQNMLWRAEQYREQLGDGYGRFLRRVFGKLLKHDAENPIDPCLRDLVCLPFSHIMTTNYDTCLQQAHNLFVGTDYDEPNWMHPADVRNFLFGFSEKKMTRCYIHLHGRYDEPERIVLTNRDYVERYVLSNDTSLKLSVLFSTHRIAFFGFSLDDPDFMYVFREVNSRLGGGDVRHYAVLAVEDPQQADLERERLQAQYGIDPIFYLNKEEDKHQNLTEVLQLITAEVNRIQGKPEAGQPASEGSLRELRDVSPESVVTAPSVPLNPEDPQKGRWGGRDEHNGRRLSAEVMTLKGSKSLFRVQLEVSETAREPLGELTGSVTFHLHPTFTPMEITVPVVAGKATHTVIAYGAFTVGAVADNGVTTLELDLSKNPSYPWEFRIS